MTTALSDTKAWARKAASKVRKTAHDLESQDAPLKLMGHRFPATPAAGASVISGFFPYKSEIDVRPLLGKLAGEGWTTCLPIVVAPGKPLVFRAWKPGEPTVPGVWDIPRPSDDAQRLEPDLLLVPMLAFDRRGFRLGYGGGFYDRTLGLLRAKKKIVALGVAYAAQEVAEVPHDSQDQPLDHVMTEREVFACA